MKRKHIYYFLFLLVLCTCRQAYDPPAIRSANQFLVINGFINASSDATTTITLSRTRNFADTFSPVAESNAQVIIEGRSGSSYALDNQGGGVYAISHLNLNRADQYRLEIVNGQQSYLSDFVPVKVTPPIDSLTWAQNRDVTVYAASHDVQNQTRYYRWDYVETWQYRSRLETVYGVDNNHHIYYRDTTFQVYYCWKSFPSNSIVLGNSLALNQDVIARAPIAVIPQNSEKLGIRYSILVTQYALTEEAYKYWQILQRNSQQMGSLFDPQPAQLKGNIHSVTNPSEPVIGFVSASTTTQKRLFISRIEIGNWLVDIPGNCDTLSIARNADPLFYNFPDTSFVPYYFVNGGPLVIIRAGCVDCTLHGGNNHRPSFW